MGVYLPFFFREVSQSLRRNVLLNIASASTVLVLIFMLGFFSLMVVNVDHLIREAMKKIQVVADLKSQVSIEKAGQVKFRIMKMPEVERARFISKEVNLKNFQKDHPDIDIRSLNDNPLPNTIEVDIKEPDKIEYVKGEIKKYPEVEAVKSVKPETLKQLLQISKSIRITGIVIVLVLLVSTVFLIANTIRLTVYSRRKEIEIMELVGSPLWFIRGPFVLEGLLHGFAGSVLAILLLNLIYSRMVEWVVRMLKFVPLLSYSQVAFDVSLFLLIIGILVGGVASYLSVNKYLKICK